jgi:AhpD family alkylhydroperoxidase
MRSRIKFAKVAPSLLEAMQPLNEYVHNCGLEPSLVNLVVVRASQINGCAFCLDMHTKDARARGETEQRLYGLNAWRETPYYTEREMAALAWTEDISRFKRPGSARPPSEPTRHITEKRPTNPIPTKYQ